MELMKAVDPGFPPYQTFAFLKAVDPGLIGMFGKTLIYWFTFDIP